MTINGRNDPSESFLFDRAKKITWISSAVQTWFGYRCRIKTALECEPRLHRRIIKSADDEVFTAMSFRAAGELFVFGGEPLHHFGPGNITANLRQDRQQ